MQLTPDEVATLLRACAATGEEELTCDELLEILAAHLEWQESRPSSDRRHELAVEHLRLCPSCQQESEALAALIREPSRELPRDA